MRPPCRPASSGRSVRRRPSTRLLAALAVVIVPAAASGCAAGQRAQTANEFSVVDGASANVGSMGLRNAGITAPTSPAGYVKGASVTLSMTVVNNGDSSDSLVSVSTPNATRATITAPTSTASRARPRHRPPGSPCRPTERWPSEPGAGAAKITLTGLSARLVPGQLVAVTMNFQVAGQVTVQLPVKLVPGQTGGQTVDVSPPTNAGA